MFLQQVILAVSFQQLLRFCHTKIALFYISHRIESTVVPWKWRVSPYNLGYPPFQGRKEFPCEKPDASTGDVSTASSGSEGPEKLNMKPMKKKLLHGGPFSGFRWFQPLALGYCTPKLNIDTVPQNIPTIAIFERRLGLPNHHLCVIYSSNFHECMIFWEAFLTAYTSTRHAPFFRHLVQPLGTSWLEEERSCGKN